MRTSKLVVVAASAVLLIALELLAVTLHTASASTAAALGSATTVREEPDPSLSQTWVVTSTADSGPGTLRARLESAQVGDTIRFDPTVFPPTSPVTIAVTNGTLPNLGQGNMTIDASDAGVILDGSALISGDGLLITSGGNVIQGLRIMYFPDSGIHLATGADGNLIGGVNSTPGGPCSGQCNVISGNGRAELGRDTCGVYILSLNNTVSGNYIGTDASGTRAIPNGTGVTLMDADFGNNLIGGLDPGSANLISGNDRYNGVLIFSASDNRVLGNLIGTDASGSSRLPNEAPLGIYWDSKRNVVEGNVLTGNFDAIQIAGNEAQYNIIRGNWMGTNPDGDVLGNLGGAVELTSAANHNVIGPGNVMRYCTWGGIWLNIGASDNQIFNNDISYNTQGEHGVGISDPSTVRNTVSQNSITGNDGPGIALLGGGNAGLPAPVLTSLDLGSGSAVGSACPNCTVEIFSDDEDEGRWYEGTAAADQSGYWSFAKGSPLIGPHLTATATDPDGNTSEFSAVSDMAVVGVVPNGEVAVGQPTAVRAELFGAGVRLEDQVPVACTIEDPSGATAYEQAAYTGPIPAGTWAMVELPDWTPEVPGDHTLICTSLLAVDQEPGDDAFSQTVTAVEGGVPDAWTRDNEDDTGQVPAESPWWVSPDIWVRNQPDGGLVDQDPIAFQENTVYVRLRNRGTAPASGAVGVYWDRSRVGWPCKVEDPNVGTIAFDSLAPGEVRIVSLTWTPEEPGHHGLFTVIDAEGDPPDWEQPCSPQRPRYDNNISWKNVVVFLNPPERLASGQEQTQAEVQVVNVYDQPKDVDVIIDRLTFPPGGTASLFLSPDLFDRWWAYDGHRFEGVEVLTETQQIRLTADVTGTIGALPLEAGEVATATLEFDAPAGSAFELGLQERIEGLVVGGVAYEWQVPDAIPPGVVRTSPGDGQTRVDWDAPVVITFSEPVGPLTLDLSLAPDPGGWSLAWNEADTVLTATHADFAAETSYLATVTANDAWGNAMAEPFTWSFATGPAKRSLYLPIVLRNSP